VIHGKYTHEESRATASQASKHPNGKYILVRDIEEAGKLCDYIAERPGRLDRDAFVAHFEAKSSPGFDPESDLRFVGVANQTTMLANDSIAIGMKIHQAMIERHGTELASEHYRSFGTICSATQERQDAVAKMMERPPDVMLVIGGYNSSNTNHLAHLCRQHTRTYHVEDADCIDVDTGTIRHKPDLSPDAEQLLWTGHLTILRSGSAPRRPGPTRWRSR
jgi:4-hydroxy-3-methylbut-2-enyl diphosphate reductase